MSYYITLEGSEDVVVTAETFDDAVAWVKKEIVLHITEKFDTDADDAEAVFDDGAPYSVYADEMGIELRYNIHKFIEE